MSIRIDDRYIAEFFGIEDTEEGAAELSDVTSKLKRMVFNNNEDICTVDSEPDGMFFIDSGSVVVLDRDGRQVNILHVRQYFGEYGVLSGQKRLSTVRSIGKTVVYKMESEDLLGFLSKHPDIYGELMKCVYAQISNKHSQILALSGMRRGVLFHPSNSKPLTGRQMLIQYGAVALIYILALFFVPSYSAVPSFFIPLVFMLVYVLVTKRTIESLVTSGILAAILVYRAGVFTGYADSLMDTMGQSDNVFTVLVMALMGGMIELIAASGGITAFEKTSAKHCRSQRSIFLSSFFIMAVTAIDDGLNMLTASYSSYGPAKEKGVIREKLALIYSMLPTVLSSFLPLSLWGIFVTGTLFATVKEDATSLFVRSVPFNFYSIVTVIAMILFSFGLLPMSRQLKDAQKRYDETGMLYPKGSERYLSLHDTEVWGKISNVIIPIASLAVSSVAIRSIINKSFVTDSAVGLLFTLAFMFIMYCFRKIMTPQQFMEHLIDGISESVLPIVLYLLTVNFASLIDSLGLHVWLAELMGSVGGASVLLPAVTFIVSMLLAMALGSSWSMYAIVFPIVINMVRVLGIDPALIVGAVAGAGIAGEKNCAFTSDALNVGTAVGIDPVAVKKVRIPYSLAFTTVAALLYLVAGFM